MGEVLGAIRPKTTPDSPAINKAWQVLFIIQDTENSSGGVGAEWARYSRCIRYEGGEGRGVGDSDDSARPRASKCSFDNT